MKLLFIIPELSLHTPGGISTYYRNLLPKLRERCDHIDVLVVSPFGTEIDLWSDSGIDVSHVETESVLKYMEDFQHLEFFPLIRRMLASAWAAFDSIKDRNNYDLVSTVDWGFPFIPWVLDANSPPVEVHLHGSCGQISIHDPIAEYALESYMMRLLEQSFLPLTDQMISPSPANQAFWENSLGKKVRYIPPPIYEYSSEQTPIRSEGLVIGRLQKWKGPEVTCKALKLLSDTDQAIRWIGREMPTINLKTKMRDHLISQFPSIVGSTLSFENSVPYKEVKALQASSRFNLIPSSWDVFNFTVIEALLSGRPTICSSGAGASCLIEHGANGFLFPAEDADALASCIRQACNMSEEATKQMSDTAVKTIRNKLAPDKIADETAACFKDTIAAGISTPKQSPSWISDFVSPNGADNTLTDSLSNLPLKKLLKYSLQRTKKKLLGKS